jgi:hypothetical protein
MKRPGSRAMAVSIFAISAIVLLVLARALLRSNHPIFAADFESDVAKVMRVEFPGFWMTPDVDTANKGLRVAEKYGVRSSVRARDELLFRVIRRDSGGRLSNDIFAVDVADKQQVRRASEAEWNAAHELTSSREQSTTSGTSPGLALSQTLSLLRENPSRLQVLPSGPPSCRQSAASWQF